ncbi:MAG: UPF0758 domain-containing protein [Nitrospiraceae bacterium]
MLRQGADHLSDAITGDSLRVGREDASAVQVGMDSRWGQLGGIQGLIQASTEELCQVSGIGPAKAAQLKAAVEVGKRAAAAPLSTGTRVHSSADLFKHYHARLRDLRHEVFFAAVLLDAKHCIIRPHGLGREVSRSASCIRGSVSPRRTGLAAAVIFLAQSPERRSDTGVRKIGVRPRVWFRRCCWVFAVLDYDRR